MCSAGVRPGNISTGPASELVASIRRDDKRSRFTVCYCSRSPAAIHTDGTAAAGTGRTGNGVSGDGCKMSHEVHVTLHTCHCIGGTLCGSTGRIRNIAAGPVGENIPIRRGRHQRDPCTLSHRGRPIRTVDRDRTACRGTCRTSHGECSGFSSIVSPSRIFNLLNHRLFGYIINRDITRSGGRA